MMRAWALFKAHYGSASADGAKASSNGLILIQSSTISPLGGRRKANPVRNSRAIVPRPHEETRMRWENFRSNISLHSEMPPRVLVNELPMYALGSLSDIAQVAQIRVFLTGLVVQTMKE